MDLQERLDRWRGRHAGAPGSRAFAPLADLLRQAGLHHDALSLLDQGLAAHPGYLTGLIIQGMTLLELGRASEARTVLLDVLGKDPQNLEALRLLAAEARIRQDWRTAEGHLAALAGLEPDDARWARQLAEVKEQGRLAVPGPAPAGTAFATMTLVDIYLAQGYQDKALAALGQMLAAEPGREDIRRRIVEIQALPLPYSSGLPASPGASAAPPAGAATLADDGAQPDPGRLALRRRQAAERRALDKQQFQAWVSNIRRREGKEN